MNSCDINPLRHDRTAPRHSAGSRVGRLILVALLLLTTGCAAVGPNYVPPTPALPSGWHEPLDPALVPGGETVRRWWTLFDDPALTRLIEEAAESNLDLMAAMERVEEARARLGIVTGERVPAASATGDISRRRTSDNALGSGFTETFYAPGLSASWELDLFGRIKRSVEAATADYQAEEEDRVDVMISLYSRVALTYLDLRTFQARLSSAEANIASQKEVLALTSARFRNGLATDLDVAQAERILAGSEAEVPPLRSELSRAVNTLAALYVRGMEINVYTEIGIVLLIALTCKTAILISEFAKASREEGESITGAALKAARLRFRPILMTAFTFILGGVPAGGGHRRGRRESAGPWNRGLQRHGVGHPAADLLCPRVLRCDPADQRGIGPEKARGVDARRGPCGKSLKGGAPIARCFITGSSRRACNKVAPR